MTVTACNIRSAGGHPVKFGGRQIKTLATIVRVTIAGPYDNVEFDRNEYYISSNLPTTIPVTWPQGSDPSYVSASIGTFTRNGLELPALLTNTAVTVTDTMHRVSVSLADTSAVASVSPEQVYLQQGDTATFTLTYNAGYTADDVDITGGTLQGNTVTATASSSSTTVTLSTKPGLTVTVQNNAAFVSAGSSFPVRPGRSLSIPVTYLDGSDSSCISVSGGTLSGSTITLTNVTQDTTVTINPAKVQVNASTLDTTVVESVSPARQYVLPGTTASVSLTYAAGMDASSVYASTGTVSGNTWSIPTSSGTWTMDVTVSKLNAGYTYFKLDVTAKRSTSGDPYFQVSELELYDSNGTKIPLTYVTGTAGNNSSEGGNKMCDGSTSTKFCTLFPSDGIYQIFRTANPSAVSYYRMATANDTSTYPVRNPATWTLCGATAETTARSSANWSVIDSRTNDTTMGAVNYTFYTFTINGD